MSEEQKKQLEQQLWNIANTLRGKMHADEFRDYILGFIFYKYLSEKMHLYANNILKEDGITYTEINEATKEGKEYLEAIKDEALLSLGYFLKPSELFSQLAKRGNGKAEEHDETSNFILEDLANILRNIEQSTMGTESEDDFDHLFEDLDLTSTKLGRTEKEKNALISKVLAHLDKINFGLEDAKGDVLGDAYEYLIGQFASGAGKKAGEFYTPQAVSTVLARLVTVGKTKLKSVYDPTCGSGSLLLRVAREVKEVSNFYGQELNRTTYNLARMNMILHGVHYKRFNLKQEDTLERPQHFDQRFEAIVANPPFSAQWSASPLHLTDDRFSQYGKLAPGSKADFAFIQHMIHHLAENGVMAVVAPHGVLFRGAAEGHIRRYLIEDRNYLDAVIGLPANIFYGTSIPTCVLVFKKCRETPENILFIDASQHFEKAGNQNFLTDNNINDIIKAYNERKNLDKYSYVAPLSEVKENDYNLNIPRYVNTFVDEKIDDIAEVANTLFHFDKSSKENDEILFSICEELGIPKPLGNNIFLLIQYKKCCMQLVFNQKIRFKDDNGNDFPDWKEKKLGDVAIFSKGKNISKADIVEDGKLECIRYGELYTDYSEIIKHIKSKTNLDKSKLIFSEFNDVIIPASGETQLDIATASCILKDNVALGGDLNIIKSKMNGVFLAYYLNKVKRIEIAKLAQGNSVVHLYAAQLKTLTISIPSLKEQQKIADFLSAIDKKIDLINTQLTKTQQYKKGLLQQMIV